MIVDREPVTLLDRLFFKNNCKKAFFKSKRFVSLTQEITTKYKIMKITKLTKGTYKVVDAQGTWIARGGDATVNGMWTANDCDSVDNLSSENNWAVEFKTFAQLKKYSQSF